MSNCGQGLKREYAGEALQGAPGFAFCKRQVYRGCARQGKYQRVDEITDPGGRDPAVPLKATAGARDDRASSEEGKTIFANSPFSTLT